LLGFNEDACSHWARSWVAHDGAQGTTQGTTQGTLSVERRAWLENRDRPALRLPTEARLSFSACVCCTGQLVFRTQLTRLLRQSDWDTLLIQLAASAKLQPVLELLDSEAFKPWVQVQAVWLCRPELSEAIRNRPGHPLFEAAEQHLQASALDDAALPPC
jgi:hypothetical protein